MCDELGNEDYMTACVTENGSTVGCRAPDALSVHRNSHWLFAPVPSPPGMAYTRRA